MAFWKKKSEPKGGQNIDLIVDDFARGAQRGSAQCQISTSQLGDFFAMLAAKLSESGMADSQVQQLFTANIVGVCPSCGIRIKGEGLVFVGSMQKRGTQHAVFTGGSQKTERLVKGSCANEKCKSKEVTIYWGTV